MVPGLAGLCSQRLVTLEMSTLSRLVLIGLAEPSPRVWQVSRANRRVAPECAEQVGEKKKKQVQLTENFELY